MAKHILMTDAENVMAFVRKAAEYFKCDPKNMTYSEADIVEGCWFALRWGLGDDCVMVFKVGNEFEPTIYGQAIHKEQQKGE